MHDSQRISPPTFPDIVMRVPPNWTVVGFLAMLGAVHLGVALPTAWRGRWEGYLSFVFAALFLAAAVIGVLLRHDISLLASRRQIRLRTILGRWRTERRIPFEAVTSVKLTLNGAGGLDARIEIVCLAEDIECPPTEVPRQEALLLAMMIGVPLIKVMDGELRRPITTFEASNGGLKINE